MRSIHHSFVHTTTLQYLVNHKFTVCAIGYQYLTLVNNDPILTHLPMAGALTMSFLYHGPCLYLKPSTFTIHKLIIR